MADAAKRSEYVSMLDITPASTPTYTLMGEGFTELTDSLNPEVSEKTYISDTSATKRVSSYSPEWSFEADVIKDQAIGEFLRNIGKSLSTGADCETTMVTYDMWELVGDLVPAHKHTVAVAMDSVASGAGGEDLTMNGTLMGVGDCVSGTYNVVSGVFTAEDIIS